jgi:hypothetical protein|tara:strand:- start:2374 stop:2826 length:453 start_codon:yes stop_codon:yes gene_type:complete
MLKLMPALEAYAVANIATQNLMGGNPFQVLLGDLNTSAGTGAYGALMGPQPGVITVKEMLTGAMNTGSGQTTTTYGALGKPTGSTTTYAMSATSPLDAVAQAFSQNIGNIIIGTALTTAGFRIANKVLRKPKTKMNKLLRDVGLGTTVQI